MQRNNSFDPLMNKQREESEKRKNRITIARKVIGYSIVLLAIVIATLSLAGLLGEQGMGPFVIVVTTAVAVTLFAALFIAKTKFSLARKNVKIAFLLLLPVIVVVAVYIVFEFVK